MLTVQALTKRFGGLLAISDLSFQVEKGIIFGVIGPNGAGKTTLFNLISGIDRATSGRIRFNGVDTTSLKTHQVSRLGIGRTFQNIRLFPCSRAFSTCNGPRIWKKNCGGFAPRNPEKSFRY